MSWLGASWEQIGRIVVAAVGIYAAVIAVIRVVGVRSISDMEAFDFATTVAIGTIIGGVAVGSTSLATGVVAIGALLVAQTTVSLARRHWRAEVVIDNRPVVLIRDGVIDAEAMGRARMTEADLSSMLRMEGVWDPAEVTLAVLETTGSFSATTRPIGPGHWMMQHLPSARGEASRDE